MFEAKQKAVAEARMHFITDLQLAIAGSLSKEGSEVASKVVSDLGRLVDPSNSYTNHIDDKDYL